MNNLIYMLKTEKIDISFLSFFLDFWVENSSKIILSVILITIIVILEIVILFKKAKQPVWKAFIPIYNGIILFKIVNMVWWNIILCFIPLVNIYVLGVLNVELAHKFGKSTLFGISSMIFAPVTYGILAFGPAKYEDDSYRNTEHNHDLGFENVTLYNPVKEEVEEMGKEKEQEQILDPNNLAVLEGSIPYPGNQEEVESVDPVIVNDYNIGPIKQEDYAVPGSYRSRNANEVLNQVAEAERIVKEQKEAQEKAAAFGEGVTPVTPPVNNEVKTLEVKPVIPVVTEVKEEKTMPQELFQEDIKSLQEIQVSKQPVVIIEEETEEIPVVKEEKVEVVTQAESIVEGRIVDDVTNATLDVKPTKSVENLTEIVEQNDAFIMPDATNAVESYKSSLDTHFASTTQDTVNTNIGSKVCPNCNTRLSGNATTCFLCGTKIN